MKVQFYSKNCSNEYLDTLQRTRSHCMEWSTGFRAHTAAFFIFLTFAALIWNYAFLQPLKELWYYDLLTSFLALSFQNTNLGGLVTNKSRSTEARWHAWKVCFFHSYCATEPRIPPGVTAAQMVWQARFSPPWPHSHCVSQPVRTSFGSAHSKSSNEWSLQRGLFGFLLTFGRRTFI